jgi:hypothetical protein
MVGVSGTGRRAMRDDHRRLNKIDYTVTGTVSKPPLLN